MFECITPNDVYMLSKLALQRFYMIMGFYLSTFSCTKPNAPQRNISLPEIITTPIVNITLTGAQTGGKITSNGGDSILEKGVCWSTVKNPTTFNAAITLNGTGSSSFISHLTNLLVNTTYYVRAYAVNSKGIAYGNEISFKTLNYIYLPYIVSTGVTNITDSSAIGGGNIINDGGAPITAKGICWGTSPYPTITTASKLLSTSTNNTFTGKMSGLAGETTYYMCAFATNSQGTIYSRQDTFKTNPKKFKVGDYHGGGMVFYLDSTKSHGIIVALVDQSNSQKWDSGATATKYLGANGSKIGTGLSNTRKIIAAIGNGNNAASVCVNYRGGGYTDWFLPSLDELNYIFNFSFNPAIKFGGPHWSSTELENDGRSAMYSKFESSQYSGGLYSTNGGKTSSYSVRAIRYF